MPRSPPRFSRCRWTRLLLAGMGAPAQAGERCLRSDPLRVVASAGEELAGDLWADPGKSEQAGRHVVD